MKILRVLPVMIMCLILSMMVGGCSSETEDDGLKYDAQKDSGKSDAFIDVGPTCGPTTLCERSITECEAEMTQVNCEKWYVEGACKDMTAYTTCNCACISKATCGDYFSCGEICFADHCS